MSCSPTPTRPSRRCPRSPGAASTRRAWPPPPRRPPPPRVGRLGSHPLRRVRRRLRRVRRPRGRWAGDRAADSRRRTSARRRSLPTGASAATDLAGCCAMATHIALLRGINVGGRNKVPMADLRALVTGLGHTDVATYIQSGNVLFTSGEADTEALAAALEKAIADSLGVRPAVIVLSRGELERAVRDNPYPDEPNPKMVHAVFFRGQVPAAAADAIEAGQRRAAERGSGRDRARIVGRTLF